MSIRAENTLEELKVLEGATIEKIELKEAQDEWWDFPVVRLRVHFAEGVLVNGSEHGVYEIWQDEEGNGPGYMALVSI